jgi:hypothetical protein
MAGAQDATTGVEADEVPWKDCPVFPEASIAILVGDPTKAGVAVQRAKSPPDDWVAPHTPLCRGGHRAQRHPGERHGDTFEAKGELLKPGGLCALPADHPDYVWTTTEEAIVPVQLTGPGGIDFINPADDPRKRKIAPWARALPCASPLQPHPPLTRHVTRLCLHTDGR